MVILSCGRSVDFHRPRRVLLLRSRTTRRLSQGKLHSLTKDHDRDSQVCVSLSLPGSNFGFPDVATEVLKKTRGLNETFVTEEEVADKRVVSRAVGRGGKAVSASPAVCGSKGLKDDGSRAPV